ncbi:MAG: FAD-dependent oxidoreductase [Bacteriovoracaceae bacterium]|nr:FAD-dependent oxidoreductase [Bacteriovoracaceae bacterium]
MTVLGSYDPDKPIHIYGAGMAGLFLGYFLKKNHIPFKIFETSDRVGGKISSQLTDYGLIETAANAIVMNDIIDEMLNDLKLRPIYARHGLKRIIFRQGKMKTYPLSLSDVLKIIPKLLKEIPVSAKSETATVSDFFIPLLGADVVNEVLTPALSGIYASRADELHLHSLFPSAATTKSYLDFILRFFKENKKYKKKIKKFVSVSFEKGMGELVNHLEKELKEHLFLSTKKDLELSVNNIICTDTMQAAQLIPSLQNELNRIPYKKVLSATIFTRREIPVLKKAFGALFARGPEFKSLGVLNNFAIFNRARQYPHYSYTFISEVHALEHDYQKLTQHDLDEDVLLSQVKIWEKGIPVYNQQRHQSINAIETALDGKNILLFSHYTGSLSLRAMATSAYEFVESIKDKAN